MNAQVTTLHTRRLKPMSCPADEVLLLLAEGPESEHSAMLEHVRSCSSCAAKVEELRTILSQWRTTDLIDGRRFDDEYFSQLASHVEQALDVSDDSPAAILRGPRSWWRRPAAVAAALAASVLLFVAVVSQRTPEPEAIASLSAEDSLEQLAREMGRSLLSEDEFENDSLELEYSSFLATWNVGQYEPTDELSPLPLTTTLADELEMLDSEALEAVVLRL